MNAVQFWAEGTIKFLDPRNNDAQVVGAVTDGVTRVKIEIKVKVDPARAPFRVQLLDSVTKQEGGGLGTVCPVGTAPGDRCEAPSLADVGVVRQEGEYVVAQAWYQVPDAFVREGSRSQDEAAAARSVLVVVFDQSSQRLLAQPLRLTRLPLILVHGTGGDPIGTWKDFQPFVSGDGGKYMVTRADYTRRKRGQATFLGWVCEAAREPGAWIAVRGRWPCARSSRACQTAPGGSHRCGVG